MKITIEHYDTTLSAEIPDGSDVAQTLNVIRVLLTGVGYQQESINKHLIEEEDE